MCSTAVGHNMSIVSKKVWKTWQLDVNIRVVGSSSCHALMLSCLSWATRSDGSIRRCLVCDGLLPFMLLMQSPSQHTPAELAQLWHAGNAHRSGFTAHKDQNRKRSAPGAMAVVEPALMATQHVVQAARHGVKHTYGAIARNDRNECVVLRPLHLRANFLSVTVY